MSFILAVPAYLWNGYIVYLWNYDSNSWVATIAYVFRILAIIAILPTLVLSLLDVTSYVIARTLGDPTASTSHKSSFATDPSKSEPLGPTATTKLDNASSALTSSPSVTAAADVATTTTTTTTATQQDDDEDFTPPDVLVEHPTPESHTPTFFVGGGLCGEGEDEEGGAARLAGVGVFSPVASLPGSPVTSRRNLLMQEREKRGGEGLEEEGEGEGEEEEEGVITSGSGSESGGSGARRVSRREREREREHGHGHERSASGGEATCGSTSGESSFALLEREESFEDAGAQIRRRVPGTTTGTDD
ncbi:hypothetical protein BJV78DRAFT_1278799 [Lactifluus subvellereus]|nr:hypothetical protein BJV78DRAFT_1278799 [Lactifluus subvellereus]